VAKSNELLIGLFTFSLLVVAYWGVNFLKGENVFSNKIFFYAVYDNVNGLTISRPVTVNGFKVGQVSDITFNTLKQGKLIVEISLEEDISFANNSILEIYDFDIMGAKAVQLKIIDGPQIAISGDTLLGSLATGLTSEVSEQFGSVKVSLDHLIITFNKVLTEVRDLSNTANRILLTNEEKVSNSVQSIESISNVIKHQTNSIDQIITNISEFSTNLNSIDIITVSNNMTKISHELESLLININAGKGSVGKLLNQDSIYNELSNTIKSMDGLINDIQKNPKKYVHISLWGNEKKSSK